MSLARYFTVHLWLQFHRHHIHLFTSNFQRNEKKFWVLKWKIHQSDFHSPAHADEHARTRGAYVLCIYAVWRFGFWALQCAGESFSLLVVLSSPHSQVGMKWRLSHKPSGVEQKAAKRECKRNKNRKRKPVSWTSTVSLPFTCISFSNSFFYVFQHDDGERWFRVYFSLSFLCLLFRLVPNMSLCQQHSRQRRQSRCAVKQYFCYFYLSFSLPAPIHTAWPDMYGYENESHTLCIDRMSIINSHNWYQLYLLFTAAPVWQIKKSSLSTFFPFFLHGQKTVTDQHVVYCANWVSRQIRKSPQLGYVFFASECRASLTRTSAVTLLKVRSVWMEKDISFESHTQWIHLTSLVQERRERKLYVFILTISRRSLATHLPYFFAALALSEWMKTWLRSTLCNFCRSPFLSEITTDFSGAGVFVLTKKVSVECVFLSRDIRWLWIVNIHVLLSIRSDFSCGVLSLRIFAGTPKVVSGSDASTLKWKVKGN